MPLGRALSKSAMDSIIVHAVDRAVERYYCSSKQGYYFRYICHKLIDCYVSEQMYVVHGLFVCLS